MGPKQQTTKQPGSSKKSASSGSAGAAGEPSASHDADSGTPAVPVSSHGLGRLATAVPKRGCGSQAAAHARCPCPLR